MKRRDFMFLIAEDLRKHENIFRGYKKGSIDLRCATDNLAGYLMKVIDAHMSPPHIKNPNFQGGHNIDIEPYYIQEWESDEEE